MSQAVDLFSRKAKFLNRLKVRQEPFRQRLFRWTISNHSQRFLSLFITEIIFRKHFLPTLQPMAGAPDLLWQGSGEML